MLRGDYKQADHGKVILPFTLLRRLDCVLEPTKQEVLDFYENKVKPLKMNNPEPLLNQKAGVSFHNISRFTFEKLAQDSDNIAPNLKNFINGFSVAGREIIYYFNFKYGFEEIFLTKLIECMDSNQEIFSKIIDDKEYRLLVVNQLFHENCLLQ